MKRALYCVLLLSSLGALGACSGGGGDCNEAAVLAGIPSCVGAGGGGGGGGGGGVVLTPTAAADAATTDEGGAVAIDVNDNDTPGTGATRVTAVTQPSNGAVVVTDPTAGTVTYTPDVDFSGTDTFTYTLTDSNGATSTAIVTVTVAELNPVATTLQGLTQRATFNASFAVVAGLPAESALLARSADNRITIGPLADPSFDIVFALGAGGGQINIDSANSFAGGFEGSDGDMNFWEINLDSQAIQHGSLDNVLVPAGWPHDPFLTDDPGTPLDESDPANAGALSTHFARIALTIPGPLANNLDYASYGIWEIEGQNIFGTSYVGGALAFGVLTSAGAMPTTGMAAYNGIMHGLFTPEPGAGALFNTQSFLSGTAALTADFAAGTVSADFTGITAAGSFGLADFDVGTAGPAGAFVDIHADGTISGNGFTGPAMTVATPGAVVVPTVGGAPAVLNGEMAGNFFGPAAEEAAGVLRLGDPGGAQIVGGFAVTQ